MVNLWRIQVEKLNQAQIGQHQIVLIEGVNYYVLIFRSKLYRASLNTQSVLKYRIWKVIQSRIIEKLSHFN